MAEIPSDRPRGTPGAGAHSFRRNLCRTMNPNTTGSWQSHRAQGDRDPEADLIALYNDASA
jgi:hypothetical protein